MTYFQIGLTFKNIKNGFKLSLRSSSYTFDNFFRQLTYSPYFLDICMSPKVRTGPEGFEPSTWRLGGVRAIHFALISKLEMICATSPWNLNIHVNIKIQLTLLFLHCKHACQVTWWLIRSFFHLVSDPAHVEKLTGNQGQNISSYCWLRSVLQEFRFRFIFSF